MKSTTVLILYAELQGYNIPFFRELSGNFNCDVHVVHWDIKKLTPYVPESIENVTYYKKSKFKTKFELNNLVFRLSPELVYICGWMDFDYLYCARNLVRNKIPVVAGFDDIYFNSIRQRIASLVFPLLRSMFFSHAWVSGYYQYEFAKRLGFRNDSIIYNLLSADVDSFSAAYQSSIELKQQTYPHNFYFVGRFSEEKGILQLLKVWKKLGVRKKDWNIYFVGEGKLKINLLNAGDVNVLEYIHPVDLPKFVKDFGCFILPSLREPWALVLHEFAAAGIPLIASNVCGAAPFFLIHGFNGFTFTHSDDSDLENALLKVINMTDSELFSMSKNSYLLGQRITPKMSASSFISIIK